MRYVKYWTSDCSYNSCCEIILSSSISNEIFFMLFFQKLVKIVDKRRLEQSNVLFLLDKLSSDLCFLNLEYNWESFLIIWVNNLFKWFKSWRARNLFKSVFFILHWNWRTTDCRGVISLTDLYFEVKFRGHEFFELFNLKSKILLRVVVC